MALEVFFVTGTGTDVGKTYIASRLAETRRQQGQRVGVYKPVASGCVADDRGELIADDAARLWEAAGRPLDLHTVCPQRFAQPVAPPAAAAAEGKQVDEGLLIGGIEPWLESPRESSHQSLLESTVGAAFDVLFVEGAGGLFSPISDSMLNLDFMRQVWELLPQTRVILVAPNRLGVIHDCVACVRAATAGGVTIDHIVLNQIEADDESTSTNADLIERWTGVKVV